MGGPTTELGTMSNRKLAGLNHYSKWEKSHLSYLEHGISPNCVWNKNDADNINSIYSFTSDDKGLWMDAALKQETQGGEFWLLVRMMQHKIKYTSKSDTKM